MFSLLLSDAESNIFCSLSLTVYFFPSLNALTKFSRFKWKETWKFVQWIRDDVAQSGNEMNCHSTWFKIDCNAFAFRKTHALSHESRARAPIFCSSILSFFFCSTNRGTFNSPHCFFTFLCLLACCDLLYCQRPRIPVHENCVVFGGCCCCCYWVTCSPENTLVLRTLTQWGKVVRHFM